MGIYSSGFRIKQEYLNKYKEIDKYKIEYFLLFDESNGSCIKSCIINARANLKMVRTAVTLEVWNTVNSWYHELEKFEEKKYHSRISRDFRLG